MIVYIEYVIIDNVLIDYFLLKATFKVTGTRYKKWRIFLCALLGALVSLIYPLLEHVYLIALLVKLLSGVMIIVLANSYLDKRSFYINTAVFFLLTFLVGGTITAIFNLFGIKASSEFSIAIMFLPVLAITSTISLSIKGLYKNKHVRTFVYQTELKFNGKCFNVNGFLDTGNVLFDGDSPVIVCGKKLFLQILGEDVMHVKLKKLEINTVNGQSLNWAFKLDEISIYIDGVVNINNNVTIALGGKSVGIGYDVILNPELFKGETAYENYRKIKKTS